VVNGNVAIAPNSLSSITGFGPPAVVTGTFYSPPDVPATQGKIDASNAYDTLAALGATSVPTNLGGYEYGPGVYHGAPAANTLEINGTLVLNGTANDVFVFQTSSTLITASASSVQLIGGAQACNVFWQVGSSATLGTGSTFVGTVIARTSVSATTSANVLPGRLLALDGAVTLDTNTITTPSTCATATGGLTPGAPGTLTPAGVAAAAAAAAAASAAAAAAAAALLAATGTDSLRPLAISIFAFLVGVALLAQSRRMRSRIADGPGRLSRGGRRSPGSR
jgi:hypothetical protein